MTYVRLSRRTPVEIARLTMIIGLEITGSSLKWRASLTGHDLCNLRVRWRECLLTVRSQGRKRTDRDVPVPVDTMDDAYVARYRDLYERHWWWRSREEYLVDLIRKIYPGRDDLAIMDIGCGDGLFFDALTEFGTPEGIEPTPGMLSDRPKPGLIYEVPLDDDFQPARQYDLVLILDVVEHIDHDVNFLGNARRLLKPDGKMVITVPAFNLIWTAHDDLNHHKRRYTKSMMRSVANRAGLRVRSMTYFDQWTFPAKMAIRLKERVFPNRNPQPPEVPPKWINTLLTGICRFEHKTVGRLPLGFGSSLLIIAELGDAAG